MSVQAYITSGATIIPVLLPDAVMQDTARQIGIPEADLLAACTLDPRSRSIGRSRAARCWWN